MLALEMSSYTIAKALIDYGADVCTMNDLGIKPIHVLLLPPSRISASVPTEAELSKIPVAIQQHGRRPHTTTELSAEYLVELISYKAPKEVDAMTENRENPLYLAAKKGDDKLFSALLKCGADPSVPILNGSTLLHELVYLQSLKLTKILLKHTRNAGIDVMNSENQTPLDIAESLDLKEMIEVLNPQKVSKPQKKQK
jgi:ankyrin repeat protein